MTQAIEAITREALASGRRAAREEFIETAFGAGGRLPNDKVALLTRMCTYADGPESLCGLVICLSEEAAGIMAARELETSRVRALEEKLAVAERTIRNLMETIIPRVLGEGGDGT